MADYSFMRTGNNQDSNDQLNQKIIDDHMTLLTIFMEDAMHMAATYVEHSGRRGVSSNDIALGLKVRAVHGDQFWNRDDIQQKIRETEEGLREMEEEDSEEETEDISEIVEEWRASTHDCAICNTMNQIEPLWQNWNPTDRNNQAIKRAINQAL